jgi:hypothetical protein
MSAAGGTCRRVGVLAFSVQQGSCQLPVSVRKESVRSRLSAPGSWLLAPGTWHLAPGSWELAPGSWLLAPGSWLLSHHQPLGHPGLYLFPFLFESGFGFAGFDFY